MSDQPQYPAYPGPEQPEPQQSPPAGYGQAPPPPGYHPPPPPPPGYGQTPPQGYPASAQPPTYSGQYASWISRVGALLLDGLFGMLASIPMFIGVVIFASTVETTTGSDDVIYLDSAGDPIGMALILIGAVLAFAFGVWNYVFRQGRKGQTLGKGVVGIKVVKEATGEYMGAGLALGRYLLSSLLTSATCYLNLLWPLWDDKNQTLHDKVVSTVVLKAD